MRKVSAWAGLLLLLCAAPAAAQSRGLSFAAWGSYTTVSSTTKVDESVGEKVDFENGWGAGLGVGYSFAGFLEADVTASFLRTRGRLDLLGSEALNLGHLRIVPISALLRFHPARSGPVDPWIGVGGAWVMFNRLDTDDLTAAVGGPVEVKDRAALVVDGGIAFRLAPRFSFFVGASYMPLRPTSRGPSGSELTLKLDPVTASAGFRIGM